MHVTKRNNSLSPKKYVLYTLICLLLSIILIGFLGELVVRIKGWRPWQVWQMDIKVEPQGKIFTKHALLGYIYLPGEFKVILNNDYSFHATHLENALRITHPLASYNTRISRPEIWIFGCSFTYGWALNDEETFPWLLQEKLQGYEIVNFGTSGYGTLHALIQFKEAIKKRKRPKLVILAYASFHDERNTFLRSRRKAFVPWNHLGILVQPYARFDNKGKLQYGIDKAQYSEFPLMRYSAFMHWMENKFNMIEDSFYHSHEVSKAIIRELSFLCKTYDIRLIVAGIMPDARTYEMLKYCEKEGIATVDISVDLGIPENTLCPLDGHPSADANRKYAEKLYSFLNNKILNGADRE